MKGLAVVLAVLILSLLLLYGCAAQQQPPKEEKPMEKKPSASSPTQAENQVKNQTESVPSAELSKEDMELLDEFIKDSQPQEAALDDLPVENPIFEKPA